MNSVSSTEATYFQVSAQILSDAHRRIICCQIGGTFAGTCPISPASWCSPSSIHIIKKLVISIPQARLHSASHIQGVILILTTSLIVCSTNSILQLRKMRLLFQVAELRFKLTATCSGTQVLSQILQRNPQTLPDASNHGNSLILTEVGLYTLSWRRPKLKKSCFPRMPYSNRRN